MRSTSVPALYTNYRRDRVSWSSKLLSYQLQVVHLLSYSKHALKIGFFACSESKFCGAALPASCQADAAIGDYTGVCVVMDIKEPCQ